MTAVTPSPTAAAGHSGMRTARSVHFEMTRPHPSETKSSVLLLAGVSTIIFQMPLNQLVDLGNPIRPPDVQRTSLGLDVLSRFICNTWDEAVNNGGLPFDAIVIGAGMFGGYCAEKIFRFGAASSLRGLVLQ